MPSTKLRILPTLILVLLAGMMLGPASTAAHEIPTSVVVRAFLKPEGDRLRLLIRVPLEAMRDFNMPVYGPGFLELDRVEPILREGAQTWLLDYLDLYENDVRISGDVIAATRVSLPSDVSFANYDSALAHTLGPPLPAGTEIVWQQALMDVLIEYPIGSDQSDFSFRSELSHLGMNTTTVLHFVPPDSPERVFQFTGNLGLVRLDPSWGYAALSFVRLGFAHILQGIDHVLFVLLLVIPFRKFVPLVAIITSFTVAHSITLIAAAMGMAPTALWFPPLIETLIALSIVYMAFENIVGANLKRRWLIAFAFGLIHGFGFSFLLRESLQFAGSHLLTSLVAFNVGVELGQILIVAISVPLLVLLFKYVVEPRVGTIILSGLVAHTAWHWMSDRYAEFSLYPIEMPPMSAGLIAMLMRWTMVLLILALAVWGMYGVFGRAVQGEDGGGKGADGESDPGRDGEIRSVPATARAGSTDS